MALPTSGTISFDDFNEELGNPFATELDISSSAVEFSLNLDPINWSDDFPGLGMNEFYSASKDSLTVTPIIWEFLGNENSKNFIVNSKIGTVSISSKPTWITISNLSNSGFTATAAAQIIGQPLREGFISVTNGKDTEFVTASQVGVETQLSIDPTIINLVTAGTAQQFIVTSNTEWTFSSIAPWINLNPTIGTSGSTSINVSAAEQTVGYPYREDFITLSSNNGDITISDILVSQEAGEEPVITITPESVSVGGLQDSFTFTIDTNASSYVVTEVPSFVNGYNINEFGLTVTFDDNNASGASSRQGTITVETDTGIPGLLEATDSSTITQAAVAPESIQVYPEDGIGDISPAGEENKIFIVNVDDNYTTQWEALKVQFFEDPTDWATINTFYYDNGQYGDGKIDVSFSPNEIGNETRRVGIQAKKLLSSLSATYYVTQDGIPATLTLIPSDNVDVDINGNGSFEVTSNTAWGISYTNNSFLPAGTFSPINNPLYVPTVTTVTISANARPVGTTTTRQQDITIQTTAPGGDNVVITDYTLIQAANTASISIVPDNLTVGGLTTNANFSVSTNASSFVVVSVPSFVTNYTITEFGLSVTLSQNNAPGATQRSGTIEIRTNTNLTEATDSAIITQSVALPETIDTTPDTISGIPSTGQNGYSISVDVEDAYNTTWVARVEGFDTYTPPSVTFTSLSSGTGDGNITFNVGSNPDTEQRIGRIVVEKSSDPSIYGVTLLFQDATANTFTYADAGVSGFSVARNTGQVTAPQASLGTITNRVYSSGFSGGFYPLVTSVTQRSVAVTVSIPSGYDNYPGTVSGTETFSQDIADETLSIVSSTGTGVTNTGEAFTISVTTSPVYNTSWVAELINSSPNNSSGWISFSGAGTGDGSFTVVVGSNSSGNLGYTGATRTFSIRVNRTGGGLSSTPLSFSQTVYTPPPPPDEVNLVIDSGCTGGLNSGYIDLSATDGSGNYKYHIATSLPANLNLPSTYNGTRLLTSLPNGTYYVAVYDLNNNVYDFTTVSINCVATTTTTTTTAAPQSWISERVDNGTVSRIGLVQGYSEGDSVLVNDGSGICWLLGSLSTLAPVYTITGPCPPPTTTTTTTTTIGLTSFQGSVNANANTACSNAFERPRTYQSTNSGGLVTGATIYTGTGLLLTNTTYISDGNVYGTTNSGGIFSYVGGCQ